MNLVQATIAFAFAFASTYSQASIVFDFESSVATTTPTMSASPGSLQSLTLQESGLTMTITRPTFVTSTLSSPYSFDVIDNTRAPSAFPVGWGNRSLDPFFAGTQSLGKNGSLFQIDFSSAINFFSVEFGDFGADSGDALEIFAYSDVGGSSNVNAAATYLGSSSTSILGRSSLPNFSVGSLSASGIRSIEMRGGTPGRDGFPHSVFYDNITVNSVSAVPEPETYLMLLTGLGLLGTVARRRRDRQA